MMAESVADPKKNKKLASVVEASWRAEYLTN